MKKILLWDMRFPKRDPIRLNVDDSVASAIVRSGAGTAADPAQAGALSSGGALDSGMLTEVVLQHGVSGTVRVFLPYSVVLVGAVAGVLASIGTPIAGSAPGTPTPGQTATLTANPVSRSIAADAASGTFLFAIGNVPAGVTPTVSPNDGRFKVVSDGASGWNVVTGASALSAGLVNVSANAAGATSVAVAITITSAAAFAPISLRTTQDLTVRLASTAVTPFAAGTGTTGTKEILVDASKLYQTWQSAGAALTDSAATVLMAMPQDKLTAFLTAVFHPTQGLGLNLVRLCMGDPDYTSRNPNGGDTGGALTGNFSIYDNSTTNDNLASFSTAQDDVAVFPILRQIIAINKDVDLMVAPWTPPKFFKNPAVLAAGAAHNYYQNTPANNTLYAQYFVKYQQDLLAKVGKYAKWQSLQNEPNFTPQTYPGCQFNPSDLLALGVAVRSAFDAAGITSGLVSGDVSWGDDTVGGNSFAAYPFVQGSPVFVAAAFHAYGTQAANTPAVQNIIAPYTLANGSKPTIMMSEFCDIAPPNSKADLAASWLKFMGDVVIGSRAYGAGVICFWNLALDPNGQPGTADNLMPVANIAADGSWTFTQQFYALAHIASYTKPGATRIAATSFGTIGRAGTDVQTIAHKNLDGSISLDLLNTSSASATVTVKDQQAGNKTTTVTLAPLEIRSTLWKNAAAISVPDKPVLKVTATSSTTARVDYANKPPANGGAAISGIDIYDATASGQEGPVVTNAAIPYDITGLPPGGTIYVQGAVRNSAGPSIRSDEISVVLPAANVTTPAHYMRVSGSNSNAYANSSTINNRAGKSRRAQIWSQLDSYHAASGKNLPLEHTWAKGAASASTAGHMFAMDPNGVPHFLFFTAAGVYGEAVFTTPLDTVYSPSSGVPIYLYPVLNLDSNPLATEIMVGGSTVNGANQGGAAFTAPGSSAGGGSAAFFWSLDGITWSQLGATVTGLPTTGISPSGVPVIGHGGNTDTPPSGKFFSVVTRDEAGILSSPDFTAQASNVASFKDAQGSVWNINNSALV